MAWQPTYYRIQDADRDVALLLDPAHQTSTSYCTDTTRAGVSVMPTLEDLAGYLCQAGIPFDATSVVVAVRGYRADDEDEDAHLGALLIHPTEIVSVEPMTDRLADLIDIAYAELYGDAA